MARSSVTIRLNAKLKERRDFKKNNPVPTNEEMDAMQRDSFLNISRDYGSVGTGLDGQGNPLPGNAPEVKK